MQSIHFLTRILIASLLLTTIMSVAAHFTSAHAQTSSDCYKGLVMPETNNSRAIKVPPVILIHGYIENAAAWFNWEPLLQKNGIPFCTVSFHLNDPCGTAIDHANELGQIIQKVKEYAHEKGIMSNQVNIVGHSKGGLDARQYLAHNDNHDVANLIMIGTPNGGDPLANPLAIAAKFASIYTSNNSPNTVDFCTPALYDLQTNANDTMSAENNNTKYYTIYGDWTPGLGGNVCSQPTAQSVGKWAVLDWPGIETWDYYSLYFMNNFVPGSTIPNDGIVPASSVESLPHHISLGSTHNCHTSLLNRPEYELAKKVLNPGLS
jgi:triacylglycerol esterase/lipase EstA (alpha/beta hydrolase family)